MVGAEIHMYIAMWPLRIQRTPCPVVESCLGLCRDFCRVVYSGAYANADVIFFSTSTPARYTKHLRHLIRESPALYCCIMKSRKIANSDVFATQSVFPFFLLSFLSVNENIVLKEI